MKKKISIIIVTYNSEYHIFDCLDSIFKYNDIGDELEIIIVDNMSKNVDQMFTTINEKYASTVKLVKNPINGGYGQGNNVGVRLAKSDIIMIMNPDVRLLQPVFLKVIKAFDDPNNIMLGMVQKVNLAKAGISYSVKLNSNIIKGIFETVICNKIYYYNSKRMYLMGACFFIDKPTFLEIGLFDENIFMYGEENELHHRLITIKPMSNIVFDKNLSYLHLMEGRPITIETWMKMLNSSLYFCRKNGFSEYKIIQSAILNAMFFRTLEYLKGNKKHVQIYTQWLQVLVNLKKDYRKV